MIPLYDENPTLQRPVVTWLLLAVMWGVWVFVQGAGLSVLPLAASVCDWGLVPGELTGRAPVGFALPLGPGMACVVDRLPQNWLTPVTSLFLHGSWGHIAANSLYLWIFGNNVEDTVGRGRYALFWLACGLAASAAHVLVDPASPVPTVGASGAISGVMGGYLLLYPQVKVHTFVPPFFVLRLPAWLLLVAWFASQLLAGLPELVRVGAQVQGGVAVWAHVGGFAAGVLLVRPLLDRDRLARRRAAVAARAAFG